MKQIFLSALLASSLASSLAAVAAAQTTRPPPMPAQDGAAIDAVVNGQVITDNDVINRSRLLGLSAGMPMTPDALARLKPQVTRQLIDQTLQLQEINRRNVVVQEADIGGAVDHIEQGNSLPAGGLRQHMEASGVPYSTLIAQLRIELGWQQVLHQVLGPGLQPTAGDMAAEKNALKAEIGATQYHLAEIFIPVTDPADEASARNFTNTVIAQLRAGAPFPIIAAQFSQSQTALQGGDLGFVQLNKLDPAVAAVVSGMPVGAISNPIRVPGGYEVVQMQEIHTVGSSMQTILSLRQAFASYPVITNGQVGPAQGAVIGKLIAAARGARSCDDIAAINASLGNVRPADPGPVNLATVSPPQFQAVLANLKIGEVSKPLVAQDGVSVIMLCGSTTQAAGLPSDDDIRQLIVERRVELESQQLLEDLRHRSIISQDQAGP